MKHNMDVPPKTLIEHSEIKKPPLATELWFSIRDNNSEQLLSQVKKNKIHETARLGDRTEGTLNQKGGYKPGRYVTIKIQNPDKTFDSFETQAVITSCEIITFSEITPDHMLNVIADGSTKEELRANISKLYGREITDEDSITFVKFEYQDNLQNAMDLISCKVLSPAEQPQGNPKDLNFDKYTIPLIEHDYPAKTPIMWNAVYKELGLKEGNIMLVGDPASTKEILEVLKKDERYLGGGAGVGFKDEAFEHLDELDPIAEAIGSVNFIMKTPEGNLRGYNTDGKGYARSLEDLFKSRGESLNGKKALILGAGGTGNAVAFALAESNMNLVILNRTISKAQELAERINSYFGKTIATFGGEEKIIEEVMSANAVINVSTKGATGSLEHYSALAPAVMPATEENIRNNHKEAESILAKIPATTILSDIVLTKEGTTFLQSAKNMNFTTLDGLPMVINQGVEAFWILHGQELLERGISKEHVTEIMNTAARGK